MVINSIEIKSFVLGVLDVNTYVVYRIDTRDAILIDPGEYSVKLVEWIKNNKLNIVAIIATHGHFDHIGGVNKFRNMFNTKALIHKNDLEILKYNHDLAKYFDIEYEEVEFDNIIDREGAYRFESIEVEILHIPGHTPGSTAIYIPQLTYLFTGDTIFAGSVGTTELPGGSSEKLIESICKIYKIYPLDTVILPGHGPITTLKKESENNLFIVDILDNCVKYYSPIL